MARKIRYAIVGLGWITQESVLPAFQTANENSEIAAFVSDDEEKCRALSQQYGIDRVYSYDRYDECLRSGDIDAVYIALPNHLHCEFTVKAANEGIHVLCEKPMAVTEEECDRMTQAADESGVKLMIAYRLHFDKANMQAVDVVQSGKIGEPRIFNSVFSQQVIDGNVRLESIAIGGGTVYDMGVYCINAARYLFQSEPLQVLAMSANNSEERFAKIDEMTSVIMRFPGDRLATFTSSFGCAPVSTYHVVGTKGDLRMDAAYSTSGELEQQLTIDGETQTQSFPAGDQFGAEIKYFSDCILMGQEPEPSGEEGLADVRIVRAIYESARSGQPISLGEFKRSRYPNAQQIIQFPEARKPKEFVNAADPGGQTQPSS